MTWLDSPPSGAHVYSIRIEATTAANIQELMLTARTLSAVAQTQSDPNEIYVQAGATNGNGTREHPFGTVEEGVFAAAEGGTVHILYGTYPIASQLVIDKPLTLLGHPEAGAAAADTAVISQTDPLPQLVFDPSANLDAVAIMSDQVTIENLHIVSNRAATGDNAIIKVPLRTLAQLYNHVTIRGCIVEGTTRSGYFWVQNLTIEQTTFLHNAANTQSLRFQMLRGSTRILHNTFRGNSSSVGAMVFEPNLTSYTVSGEILVKGNIMTNFTQFVNFYCFLESTTSLVIEDNIDHRENSGSSVILQTRPDYNLVSQLLIRNNYVANPHPTRLAVYFAGGGGGMNIPADNQIKVYSNTFHFPNGFGQRPGDVADREFPVGYNDTAGTFGMTLGRFDLQGNVNV
jgi:hypothetical protein